MTERDLSKRPKNYCFTCGGAYRTLGMSSVYVPHDEDCPRNPHRARQDREAAALRDLEAPVAVRDPDLPHDPFECPDPSGEHCEQARRRAIDRAGGIGAPGLTARPMPYELVRPDQREQRRPRVRTPDYGQEGP